MRNIGGTQEHDEEILFIDSIPIIEHSPPSLSDDEIESHLLLQFVNEFNNLIVILAVNSRDALKSLAREHAAYSHVEEIGTTVDRLQGGVRRLQEMIEGNPGPRETGTIFVVDDNEGVRHLVATILRQSGYTVFEAANGEEALRRSGAYPGRIDLILADVEMQPMKGYELVRRFVLARPDSRAIYMSGINMDHSRAMPGTEFLLKEGR